MLRIARQREAAVAGQRLIQPPTSTPLPSPRPRARGIAATPGKMRWVTLQEAQHAAVIEYMHPIAGLHLAGAGVNRVNPDFIRHRLM